MVTATSGQTRFFWKNPATYIPPYLFYRAHGLHKKLLKTTLRLSSCSNVRFFLQPIGENGILPHIKGAVCPQKNKRSIILFFTIITICYHFSSSKRCMFFLPSSHKNAAMIGHDPCWSVLNFTFLLQFNNTIVLFLPQTIILLKILKRIQHTIFIA